MMRSVLLASDFSVTAFGAFFVAKSIARSLALPMKVLHVEEDPEWRTAGQTQQWLRATSLDVCEIETRFGTPWIEILRYAAVVKATVVVVGSHGNSGFNPIAAGTTTTKLLTHGDLPVLVVTRRVQDENGRSEAVRVEIEGR